MASAGSGRQARRHRWTRPEQAHSLPNELLDVVFALAQADAAAVDDTVNVEDEVVRARDRCSWRLVCLQWSQRRIPARIAIRKARDLRRVEGAVEHGYLRAGDVLYVTVGWLSFESDTMRSAVADGYYDEGVTDDGGSDSEGSSDGSLDEASESSSIASDDDRLQGFDRWDDELMVVYDDVAIESSERLQALLASVGTVETLRIHDAHVLCLCHRPEAWRVRQLVVKWKAFMPPFERRRDYLWTESARATIESIALQSTSIASLTILDPRPLEIAYHRGNPMGRPDPEIEAMTIGIHLRHLRMGTANFPFALIGSLFKSPAWALESLDLMVEVAHGSRDKDRWPLGDEALAEDAQTVYRGLDDATRMKLRGRHPGRLFGVDVEMMPSLRRLALRGPIMGKHGAGIILWAMPRTVEHLRCARVSRLQRSCSRSLGEASPADTASVASVLAYDHVGPSLRTLQIGLKSSWNSAASVASPALSEACSARNIELDVTVGRY